jgi:16S rRNA (adenine1518-N6/adenine1519-N6)-dimethyltransferase
MEKIKAKKSLGQNFLIDEEALADIAGSLSIQSKKIIEVWPGYGALTDYIIDASPESLDLIELDTDMIKILNDKYKNTSITIYHQDVLDFYPSYEQYSVIANIPYYITSPILFHFLYKIEHKPDEMVIMMQKEVWEKIMEWRNKKIHHSFLSLCMEQACNDIEIIRIVPNTSFNPPPKIDSIVLKFQCKKERDTEKEEKLIHLWKVAFAHPRKTLLSNIKWSLYSTDEIREKIIEKWYDERVRAEAIRKEDWNYFL